MTSGPADEEKTILPSEEKTIVGQGAQSTGASSRGGASGTAYQLGEVLGEGGMATVYEAWEPELQRKIAVKVPHPEIAKMGEFLESFLYEARVLGRMDHPGVLPVYSAGELPDGRRFYAMKKIHGHTLADLLRARTKKALNNRERIAEFMHIFERVCETISAAHAQRLIHRDLKPANIMVDENGVVLVLDWGLAKELDGDAESSRTMAGDIKGTPAYMAPEQASGDVEAVDCRADVFALGVILYVILTGRIPYAGDTAAEVIHLVRSSEHAPVLTVNPKADRVLAAICDKAMDRDAAKRYADAGGLAADIRAWRDRLPVRAYRQTPLDRAGNWIYRHTAAAATLLTALLFLGVFGGLYLHERRTRELREAERAKRQAMLQEVRERERQSFIERRMQEVRAMVSTVEALDRRIAGIDRKLEAAPGDARKGLSADRRELATIRGEGVQQISAAVTSVMQVASEGAGEYRFEELPAEVREMVRSLMIDEARSHLRIGALYRAHALVSRNLASAAEIDWTRSEMLTLLELRSTIEKKMRDEGMRIPDWKKYYGMPPSEDAGQ